MLFRSPHIAVDAVAGAEARLLRCEVASNTTETAVEKLRGDLRSCESTVAAAHAAATKALTEAESAKENATAANTAAAEANAAANAATQHRVDALTRRVDDIEGKSDSTRLELTAQFDAVRDSEQALMTRITGCETELQKMTLTLGELTEGGAVSSSAPSVTGGTDTTIAINRSKADQWQTAMNDSSAFNAVEQELSLTLGQSLQPGKIASVARATLAPAVSAVATAVVGVASAASKSTTTLAAKLETTHAIATQAATTATQAAESASAALQATKEAQQTAATAAALHNATGATASAELAAAATAASSAAAFAQSSSDAAKLAQSECTAAIAQC